MRKPKRNQFVNKVFRAFKGCISQLFPKIRVNPPTFARGARALPAKQQHPFSYRRSAFMASVILTVSTLTRVTRPIKSITLSL